MLRSSSGNCARFSHFRLHIQIHAEWRKNVFSCSILRGVVSHGAGTDSIIPSNNNNENGKNDNPNDGKNVVFNSFLCFSSSSSFAAFCTVFLSLPVVFVALDAVNDWRSKWIICVWAISCTLQHLLCMQSPEALPSTHGTGTSYLLWVVSWWLVRLLFFHLFLLKNIIICSRRFLASHLAATSIVRTVCRGRNVQSRRVNHSCPTWMYSKRFFRFCIMQNASLSPAHTFTVTAFTSSKRFN